MLAKLKERCYWGTSAHDGRSFRGLGIWWANNKSLRAGSGWSWRALINLACSVRKYSESGPKNTWPPVSKGFPKKMWAREHGSRRKRAEGSDGSHRIGRGKSAPRIKSVSIRLWGLRDGKPLDLRHSPAFCVDTRTYGLKAVGVKLGLLAGISALVQSWRLHCHKTFAALKIQFQLLKQ